MNKLKMKPILLNTQMVKAILDGRKTQTRRVVKNITHNEVDLSFFDGDYATFQGAGGCQNYAATPIREYPQYKKGDILYVRETFCPAVLDMGTENEKDIVLFRADEGKEWKEPDDGLKTPWRPSIHMPKKYARIFLKVTDVRVERLQDINSAKNHYDGYFKEGIEYNKEYAKKCNNDLYCMNLKVKSDFQKLWNSTSKDGYKWEDNPYVFVYEFERIEAS